LDKFDSNLINFIYKLFSCNQIGDVEAKSISLGLVHLKKLEKFDLNFWYF
jgi:hypothetical protein